MQDPKKNTDKVYDIVIVGGGLAGASLAVALGGSAYTVAVVEAIEFNSDAQPSYDERTIALTYSAKHIFSQIGVWDQVVENEACALKRIHISNKGHFGITHLDHRDAGTEALGYVVPTRALGKALTEQMSRLDNVDIYSPFQAQHLETRENSAAINIAQTGEKKGTIQLKAKLIVIADGGRSPLLKDLGFEPQRKAYTQSALLSIVQSSKPHQHNAYERFADDGPLALLPLKKQRYAVVWTLSPERLGTIATMPDDDYIEALQEEFGTRAGLFSAPTPRKAYPLNKSMLENPCQHRVLVLGNAAHTVHPVAGQGFNLGLRDVATLVEKLLCSPQPETDIGTMDFLQEYTSERYEDTRRVGQFTDGLLTIFTHPSALVQLGRNVGLVLVENLPFAKRALLKRSMGLSRRQPRLARGLKLRKRSH